MPSERVQRQIDRLLDQAEAAIERGDWALVRDRAGAVLRLDAGNEDALAYLAASDDPGRDDSLPNPQSEIATRQSAGPSTFCDGRYEVKKFLGEGGKKRVYLCHDAKLDRDVAFALIKTDGLNAESEARIRREAQAMGKLGDHRHIVPVYDIGEEAGQPYLVTQLMGGGDVEGLIEKAPDHRLPLDTTLRI